MKNCAVAESRSLVRAMAMVPVVFDNPLGDSFLIGSRVFFSFVLSLESADELQAVSRPATRARARMRFTSILLRAIVSRGAGQPRVHHLPLIANRIHRENARGY